MVGRSVSQSVSQLVAMDFIMSHINVDTNGLRNAESQSFRGDVRVNYMYDRY